MGHFMFPIQQPMISTESSHCTFGYSPTAAQLQVPCHTGSCNVRNSALMVTQ